ncbi:ABC transporter ATP-binding protein [Algimonas porphyrae]|uniref:ABC transporter ATP-binding protein n=2 Tax=Algimonas porphyrae TaxID=1128113 RepID=A0ABQ5V4R3_9PROT|nr:ABC transporter ATP-binding protein [Algimonas porphyrae]
MLSGSAQTGGRIITIDGAPYVAALQSIDCRFGKGDCVALVGHNGSGKTTLLRTLAGIYQPVTGRVTARGRISTMFSSTLSLSDMETGRQNIGVSAVLHGISPERLAESMGDIVDLCGLGDFIDIPVALYSDGMRARLGLAMAIVGDPDILLVDEAMTTTDARFLASIRARTRYFGGAETVTVIATHSHDITDTLCNRAVWLEHGHLKGFGDYDVIMQQYRDSRDAGDG